MIGGAVVCSFDEDSTKTNNAGGDAPCFERETTTACRMLGGTAAEAYTACFGADITSLASTGVDAKAERVLMSELRAGDVVLTGEASATRVIVNQHVHTLATSHTLELVTDSGSIALTPDHVIFADGGYVPARLVKVGSTLGGQRVEAMSARRGLVINAITASGTILAAGLHGAPALAATGNEWLADVMLSAYPQYTLSYTLARLFPFSVQTYYDAALEDRKSVV